MRQTLGRFIATAALLTGCCAAQVSNVSGTWDLDVVKSTWGKTVRPVGVLIRIEHNEPKLKYNGTVRTDGGNETTFEFDGAVDGKPYPTTCSHGAARIAYKRVNPYTTSSELKTDDGKFTENATTTIDKDGKTLTRRINAKGPEGTSIWTEVYTRK